MDGKSRQHSLCTRKAFNCKDYVRDEDLGRELYVVQFFNAIMRSLREPLCILRTQPLMRWHQDVVPKKKSNSAHHQHHARDTATGALDDEQHRQHRQYRQHRQHHQHHQQRTSC